MSQFPECLGADRRRPDWLPLTHRLRRVLRPDSSRRTGRTDSGNRQEVPSQWGLPEHWTNHVQYGGENGKILVLPKDLVLHAKVQPESIKRGGA